MSTLKHTTKVKMLRGNPGKRKLEADGSILMDEKVDRLEPPPWLCPKGKQLFRLLFKEFKKSGIVIRLDKQSLALLCDAYVEYTEAKQVLQKEGMTYVRTTAGGGQSLNARPEVSIAQDAFKRFKSIATEFGMTPSSRSRIGVGAMDSEGEDPFVKFLKAQGK